MPPRTLRSSGDTKWPRTGLPWEQWDKIWKNYINIYGANTISTPFTMTAKRERSHPATGGHVWTGGHVEALLDMVDGMMCTLMVRASQSSFLSTVQLLVLFRSLRGWMAVDVRELTKPMNGVVKGLGICCFLLRTNQK